MSGPVEVHQPARHAVFFHITHMAKARLLECAPGAAIRLLDGGDDRRDRRVGEDDLGGEPGEHARAEADAGQILVTDQQVDARYALADLDDRVPLRVVRYAVDLDQAYRPSLDDDQVVVGRLTAFDRVAALGERLVDRVTPPKRDVLAAEPLLDEREILRRERPELD